MNELHFAFQVRQHLNRGLNSLRPETTNRLAIARQNALAHQKQLVGQSILATAGDFVQFQLDNYRVKQLFVSFMLVLCIVLTIGWIADRQVDELSDLDSALLADELPISAFTDKGFDAWLNNASSK